MSYERLRWSLDWAYLGALTAGLAPGAVQWALGFSVIPNTYLAVAAALGGSSGLLVGALLLSLYRALPPRSRTATLGVLLPVPLGAWGAAVAASAAALSAPSFTDLAFTLGSFSALLQMMWFVPAYTASLSRGRRWLPLLIAIPVSPICGMLGTMGTFAVGDAVRGLW